VAQHDLGQGNELVHGVQIMGASNGNSLTSRIDPVAQHSDEAIGDPHYLTLLRGTFERAKNLIADGKHGQPTFRAPY
jgi:pyruvate-formate lyase